jgi:uncharacterized membrane protein
MYVANIAFAAVILAYPVIVYFGLGHFEARLIAIALIAAAVARFLIVRRRDGFMARLPQGNLVIAALLLVGVSAMASNSPVLLQYYPVCINVLMFAAFVISLIRPPSIIEQIARIKTPDLPEAGVIYTRKVTMVWCGFFALNGAMALYTVLDTTMGFWAIYNGVISYSLMGVLFVGEYLVRRNVKRGFARHRHAKG